MVQSFNRYWQPPTSLGFNTSLSLDKGLNNAGLNLNSTKPTLSNSGLGSALGIIGGMAGGLSDLYQGITADTSDIDNNAEAKIDALSNIKYNQASSFDELMNNQAAYRELEANHTSDEFYDDPGIGGITTNALLKGASSAVSSSSPWGFLSAIPSFVGGLIGRNKQLQAADSAASKLNMEERRKNNYMQSSFTNNINSLTSKNNRMLASQIFAYGGPIGISLNPVDSAIDFMQNEELLASLGEDKTRSNNRRTSMPIFAFGGALGGYGGDWSNGLNFIKAGGTHGENPIGGVPMGVAQDGMPNLVEEGEVVWNDYVFSNRINVPKETMERLGIKGKDTMTFAEAVEKAQKSSAERPNDPIEKRGLDAVLAGLMQKQEEIRQSKAEEEQFNEMEDMAAFAADGGPIHIAKNKKGTFTAAATKHGMGVQEFAGHVLANKDKYSSAMVKKANFARNASKWHHALGGYLFPFGGHFDKDGNWVNDDMPTINWNTTTNNSIFSKDYNPLSVNKFDEAPTDWRYWTPPTQLNFKMNGINEPTKANPYRTEPTNPDLPTSGWQTYLRYAPVLGSAIGLGYTLFNKPDYEYANELEEAADQYAGSMPRVTPSLLGDYLAYNPFDRLFYANELGAQQAATRSAIMNSSNGNRGQAMAALLASSYNDNIGLGKLYREGEEYNLNQRHKVAEFNRATNQFNSEADLKAQMFNAELDKAKASLLLDAKMKALGMKQADDLTYSQNLTANLSGLFDNIGAIGNESAQRYWLNALINSGAFGTPNASMLSSLHYAKGGRMCKKKRGLTI